MLLWTFVYKVLCGHIFSIFLGIEWNFWIIWWLAMFSILRNHQLGCFTQHLRHFTFLPELYEGSHGSPVCPLHSGHIMVIYPSHTYWSATFFLVTLHGFITFLKPDSYQRTFRLSKFPPLQIVLWPVFYTGVGKSGLITVCMEKDIQVMMTTISLLTQKNVTMTP